MATQNFRHVVVAVDGSETSWHALDTAINLAVLMNRPIDVLYVVQLVSAGYFSFIDRHLREEQEAYAYKVLSEAQDRGKKAGVEVRPHLLKSGSGPATAILEYLEQSGPVKFLVLGAHGHGFVARHIIGSVTERVIREVSSRGLAVPVLVVPGKSETGD
uniref:Universal stress protein n=1 Tax=Desulfobacca acetoxidans TaxID=60893 RepID=A0A7C5ER25_9BACT